MNLKNQIPDFQSIMLPMLKLLADGKPKTLNEVRKSLTKHFNLTPEHLKIKVPSGQMGLFKNRVGWTRSYLKNAGLLFYPSRAVYQITDFGKEFLASNPKSLRLAELQKMPKYIEWQETFTKNKSSENDAVVLDEKSDKTPDEILNSTVKELNQQLASELLDKLKENSFSYFENFVVQLLDKMGYGGFHENNAMVTGQSGDNGIDGIIYQDRLGLESVYIQAKRFTNSPVGSGDIRNFIGALAVKGVSKGVFLTTSKFTTSAIETAEDSRQQRIVLIDGKQLSELAIEYNLGVQIAETIQIKKIDLDYFEE